MLQIGQCADLVRNGPLPRPDVLEIILRFEEFLVLAHLVLRYQRCRRVSVQWGVYRMLTLDVT